MTGHNELSKSMSEAEFANGYWYVGELRDFAREQGMPGAGGLRKDELETAIKHLLRTGEVMEPTRRPPPRSAIRDVDRGLSLDLEVEHYTSNRETKDFIAREARRLEPDFKPKSGTRYLLNRWREEQIRSGRRLTYADLVRQAIELNRTKDGPLRLEHGRYMNFISDFLAANPGAGTERAIEAWHEVKEIDVPKTYDAWVGARGGRRTDERPGG